MLLYRNIPQLLEHKIKILYLYFFKIKRKKGLISMSIEGECNSINLYFLQFSIFKLF